MIEHNPTMFTMGLVQDADFLGSQYTSFVAKISQALVHSRGLAAIANIVLDWIDNNWTQNSGE